MILNSNLIFKHSAWIKIQELYPVQGGPKPKIALFPRLVDLFILACSIGIRENKRVENDSADEITSVNSKTYNDPVNDDLKKTLEYLLKIIILTMDLPELVGCNRSDKEKLAFSSDFVVEKFNPTNILSEYANYGVIKLLEMITSQDTETINNIIHYIDDLKNSSITLPDIEDFDQI